MKGLDAGCGTGGPSREIARFAGVNVTGLSINALHVQKVDTRKMAKGRRAGNIGERSGAEL